MGEVVLFEFSPLSLNHGSHEGEPKREDKEVENDEATPQHEGHLEEVLVNKLWEYTDEVLGAAPHHNSSEEPEDVRATREKGEEPAKLKEGWGCGAVSEANR